MGDQSSKRVVPPRPGTRRVPVDGFRNTTPETAYLLGLIWADGDVARPNTGRYYIRVEMVARDLEEVVPVFDASGKWSQVRRTRTGRDHEVLRLETANKELWTLVEPHKRDPLPLLSAMDAELRPYWFRGMFDGDGCYYAPAGKNVRQMAVVGHEDQDWTFLTAQLDALEVSYRNRRRDHVAKDGTISRSSSVRWTNPAGCKAWHDYTHASWMKTFGLSRKTPNPESEIEKLILGTG